MEIQNQMAYKHIGANFDAIHQLSKTIQYSSGFDCYQSRKNIIYQHFE